MILSFGLAHKFEKNTLALMKFSYYEISLPTKHQQSKPRWTCFYAIICKALKLVMLQTNPQATESLWPTRSEPPQDYLEATKPTDIIPQPKKQRNNYTHHSKLQIVLPQETNNLKKQEHLSHHQNTPKKNGRPLHDFANMVTHRCLALKFYSIHKAGC